MGLVSKKIICKNNKSGQKSRIGGRFMTAQERHNIEAKISELKAAKEAVKGTNCEVYSRVVGYLRPVQNWNKGKKEEFALRKNIKLSCGC